MLTELCQELKNWFDTERHFDTFTIEDGELDLPFLLDGQYYRICGSVFNDGVHKYGDESDVLTDESFDGAVWAMAVPPAVVALDAEITAWQEKYGGVDSEAMSPFSSESFGGYSYNKGSSSGSGNGNSGNASSWQNAFASRLNNWRKIR